MTNANMQVSGGYVQNISMIHNLSGCTNVQINTVSFTGTISDSTNTGTSYTYGSNDWTYVGVFGHIFSSTTTITNANL